MRILVTGINNGLIMRSVSLLDTNPEIEKMILCDILRPTQMFERGQFEHLDLALPDSGDTLIQIMNREKIDTVVHGAFLANPARDPAWAHELEAIGSMHVLDACAAAGVKHLVLKSTTMVYGAHPDTPAFLEEDHDLRGDPTSRWVHDKLQADKHVQAFAVEHPEVKVTILRFGTVLAPSITDYMARYLGRSVVPTVAGFDPVLQFLDLDDAAEALRRVVVNRQPGVFNIVPEDVLPLSAVLRLGQRIPIPVPRSVFNGLSQALWRAQLVEMPPRFLDYLCYSWTADPGRARKQLDFRARRSSRSVVTAFYQDTHQQRHGV